MKSHMPKAFFNQTLTFVLPCDQRYKMPDSNIGFLHILKYSIVFFLCSVATEKSDVSLILVPSGGGLLFLEAFRTFFFLFYSLPHRYMSWGLFFFLSLVWHSESPLNLWCFIFNSKTFIFIISLNVSLCFYFPFLELL